MKKLFTILLVLGSTTSYASDLFLSGKVADVDCGSENDQIAKVIGDKCIIFIEAESNDIAYFGVIVNRDAKAAFGSKLIESKHLSFPPYNENCLSNVTRKKQKKLSMIHAAATQYMNFKDLLLKCWGGTSGTW
jgi:hypothetical protein